MLGLCLFKDGQSSSKSPTVDASQKPQNERSKARARMFYLSLSLPSSYIICLLCPKFVIKDVILRIFQNIWPRNVKTLFCATDQWSVMWIETVQIRFLNTTRTNVCQFNTIQLLLIER